VFVSVFVRVCVVTGDESWFYLGQGGKEQSIKSLVVGDKKARTLLKVGHYESKNLFTSAHQV